MEEKKRQGHAKDGKKKRGGEEKKENQKKQLDKHGIGIQEITDKPTFLGSPLACQRAS